MSTEGITENELATAVAQQRELAKKLTDSAQAVWPELPGNPEIDALLQMYDEADKAVDAAIEARNLFGDQIEELIARHGFMPPRATKSKRIQGDEWRATRSQSQSIDVDSTAVQRLFARMKELGAGRFFRKLFRREVVFVLNDDAQQIIAALDEKFPVASLAVLFHKTLKIASRSTTLKVEPIEKDKRKKGAAA